MATEDKIAALEKELSTFVVAKIDSYHNNKRSHIAMLNGLVAIVDGDNYTETYVIEGAWDVKAEFDDFVSGDKIDIALTGYSMSEHDMSFNYFLQITHNSLDYEFLEYSYNSHDQKLTPEPENMDRLKEIDEDELDQFILDVKEEVTFGILKGV